MTIITRIALVAIASGAAAGAAALWLGLRHNTQGEFFVSGTEQIDYTYCALVFGSWFTGVGVAAFTVATVVFAAATLIRRTRPNTFGKRNG